MVKVLLLSDDEDQLIADNEDQNVQKHSIGREIDELFERLNIGYRKIYPNQVPLQNKGYDLLLAVGNDQSFIELSHHAETLPIMGCNLFRNKQSRFTNITSIATLEEELCKWLDGKAKVTTFPRMQVSINGQVLPVHVCTRALLAHTNPCEVTDYTIIGSDDTYNHNGLLACVAGGSYPWMYEQGGKIMEWSNPKIQYVTRGKRNEVSKFADHLEIINQTKGASLFLDGGQIAYPIEFGKLIVLSQGLPLQVVGDQN